MPTVRKLSQDEVRTLERKTLGVRKAIEAEYDALLKEYNAGDYGIAELEEGEQRLTVRNRLKAAASRRSLAIAFLRTSQPGILRFKLLELEPVTDTAAATLVDTTAKRRGRPPSKTGNGAAAAEPKRRGRPSTAS